MVITNIATAHNVPIIDASPSNHSQTRAFRRKGAELSASTILETIFAAAILVIAFSGVYAVSGRASQLVRNSEDSSDVQRNCSARIEQLRTFGWSKVTSPTQLATLLSTPNGSVPFDREVISVYELGIPQTSPLPSPTPSPTPAPGSSPLFTVTKTKTTSAVVSPSTFDPTVSLGKLQLNFRVLTELTRAGRTERRELSTFISKSASR